MGVIEQAKSLATELAQSPELQNFKTVQQQILQDQTAYQLITQYMKMEQGIMVKQMQGEQITETQINSLSGYRNQIAQKNQLVAQFFTAKDQFDRLWGQVNQIIGSALS